MQRLIGTLLTRIFFDVFLLFYANQIILIDLIILTFKIPFLFYFWNLVLLSDIKSWWTCNESCAFILFRVYLSLLSNSGNNISFLCSLLINILLWPLYNICYGNFFGYPAFFDSRLIILSMFCTLFYCHYQWMGQINVPGSVHSSKPILFSHH